MRRRRIIPAGTPHELNQGALNSVPYSRGENTPSRITMQANTKMKLFNRKLPSLEVMASKSLSGFNSFLL